MPACGAGKRSPVEYCNESRFLGECTCGGHAGLGHHRRAVGDQDLLRHVEQAGAFVGDTDLSLSRFAAGAPFRGGGSLLFYFSGRCRLGAFVFRLRRHSVDRRPLVFPPEFALKATLR